MRDRESLLRTDTAQRIPCCGGCGVQHPWLLDLNSMVEEITWECNECGEPQVFTNA